MKRLKSTRLAIAALVILGLLAWTRGGISNRAPVTPIAETDAYDVFNKRPSVSKLTAESGYFLSILQEVEHLGGPTWCGRYQVHWRQFSDVPFVLLSRDYGECVNLQRDRGDGKEFVTESGLNESQTSRANARWAGYRLREFEDPVIQRLYRYADE